MTYTPYNSDPNEYDNDILSYAEGYSEEDFVAELMSEGYSEDEARRMAGDYDADDYDGGETDLDRDVPDMADFDSEDFVDEEDFD
jgi:hypothetical protein